MPFRIDDGLVFGDLIDPDFGIVFLRLQFELDVEADNLRVLEGLRLLLETGVGEGLLEGNAVDEERVLQSTASDFLDAYQLLVEVVLVEGEDSVDDHCR